MNIRKPVSRFILLMVLSFSLAVLTTRLQAQTGCNPNPTPFTDLGAVPSIFCQAIAAAYFSGLTNGTSATTFSPSDPVPREQMAAFVTRALDQSLKRGSRRAALGQWWTTTPHYDIGLGTTLVGGEVAPIQSDGTDLWVSSITDGTVSRIRSSDGKLLGTWAGMEEPNGIVIAMGRVFVAEQKFPGRLYMIDPTQPPGPAVAVVSNLSSGVPGIAFDGSRIWLKGMDELFIVTPQQTIPWSVVTVSEGLSTLRSIYFDGSNIWVTDFGATLMKLDSNGAIINTLLLGSTGLMTFDGTNLWITNITSDTVSVVRASTAQLIATLSGNGMDFPFGIAFDGERVLVSNIDGRSVSLWKAADLTPLGFVSTGNLSRPHGVCSDGINFWIGFIDSGHIARF